MYDFVYAEGNHTVVVMPWPNKERRRYMALAGPIAIKTKAVAACFMSEGWMVTVDQGPANSPWHQRRAREKAEEITPSQDPNRIEIIQVIASDGETTKARIWQIVRTRPDDERAPVIALMPKQREGDDAGRYEGPGIDPLVMGLKLTRAVRDNPALQPKLDAAIRLIDKMIAEQGIDLRRMGDDDAG
jgi:hypothetical protein